LGCPGATGAAAMATGGDGARNEKALFARGNVAGLANVSFGMVAGGDGGMATGSACDGGGGRACCNGGLGGQSTSRGGRGGDASLNLMGLPAAAASGVFGGDGGAATATGGDGGDGGDCKFDDAGDGGAGGMARATGGAGGSAAGSGIIVLGGSGGAATSTAGDGGDGGDSGFGAPGAGGAAGARESTAGTGGSPMGTAGQTTANDGAAGLPGGDLPITIYCFDLGFVMADDMNMISPGVQEGPVFAADNTTQIGTLSVDFPEDPEAEYRKGTDPVAHIGIIDGAICIRTSTLQLETEPGVIGGIRLTPLFGQGISETDPLVVEALDAAGQVIGMRSFASVPNNSQNPQNPQTLDATFNVDESVAKFRIVVPPDAFVTIIQIYLLDP
ncbi:MAG TPA: hypothetical protein VGQ90_09670, partial [Stellaceae bacterium]|nr:hypothetical protein [Stellaceae bacterium]